MIAADIGIAAHEVGDGFVAGGIGGDHLLSRGADGLRFGEDRRNEERARMAESALRYIVEVKRVRGSAVDPRGIER